MLNLAKKVLGWMLFAGALIGVVIAAILTMKGGKDVYSKDDKKKLEKIREDAKDAKARIDDWLGTHPRAERV